MQRSSLKKTSTFKLQGDKNRFQNYLNEIQNCKMVKKYPELLNMIKQTSEAVFNCCYNYRDQSPFCKGLNYSSKDIGFSFQQNTLTYKQWLPNIQSAYIMGEFNNFNPKSHKLQLCSREEQKWFKIQIDLTCTNIEENGSKFMLRVIDYQGTQFYMIPPSCHIISNGYGVVKKNQILPFSKKKQRINQLLAYTIDLEKISLQNCLQLLQKENQTFQRYNTIILKNLFKNNYGAMYSYSLEFKNIQLLRDIVMNIKNQCGCKAVIQWNVQPRKMQNGLNPVQSKFMKLQEEGKYNFDFTQDQVKAYYLANASFFYQNFGIDGIHFTNIQQATKSVEGSTVLKLLNVLNSRLIDSGVTLGSSKQHIKALTGQIMQGGYGYNFTYNYHQSLQLTQNHEQLYKQVQKIHNQSNCLAINLDEYDQSHFLNLLFVIVLSKQGIFTRGDFSKIKIDLKKALKLRSQDKLFDNQITQIKFLQHNSVVQIKRGTTIILFNFSENQTTIKIEQADKMDIIFTYNIEHVKIKEANILLPQLSCILLQKIKNGKSKEKQIQEPINQN